MGFDPNVDWEEAFGIDRAKRLSLNLSLEPDIIASYEAMMVLPIWLVNDPRPRYAHELRIISLPVREIGYLVATASFNKAAQAELSSQTLRKFLVKMVAHR